MLTTRLPVVALLALMFAGGARAVEVGDSAPDIEFLQTWNMDTGKSRLSDFRGSAVLLEVWASW